MEPPLARILALPHASLVISGFSPKAHPAIEHEEQHGEQRAHNRSAASTGQADHEHAGHDPTITGFGGDRVQQQGHGHERYRQGQLRPRKSYGGSEQSCPHRAGPGVRAALPCPIGSYQCAEHSRSEHGNREVREVLQGEMPEVVGNKAFQIHAPMVGCQIYAACLCGHGGALGPYFWHTMMRTSTFCLLLVPTALSAQDMQLVSGGLHVQQGTTLQLSDGIVWQIAPGASVVNDGTIDLSISATINESLGWPIAGLGMETIAAAAGAAQPANGHGGLGLRFDQAESLPQLTISRGHQPRTDANLGSSIARWYSIGGQAALSPSAIVTVQYDATEINGASEALLSLSRAASPAGPWTIIPSNPDADLNEVQGPADPAADHLTLFEFDPLRIDPSPSGTEGLAVFPSLTDGFASIVGIEGSPLGRLRVIDATGRIAATLALSGGHQVHTDFSGLRTGAYTIVADDGRSARFVKH
jgi:hypothetical protein